MVIDIDSFLDGYMKDKETSSEKVKTRGVDLNFQKDVEDKVYNVKNSVKNKDKDIKFLKKIYDEVKDFDEDLPNKFFGIENTGALALGDLGSKYSSNFLKISKDNVGILTKRIQFNLDLLTKEFSGKDFVKILEIYRDLLIDYKNFPKTFLVQRVALGKKIRFTEIKVNSLLKDYKLEFITQTKGKLFILMTSLKKAMDNGDIVKSENFINEIEYINNSIPKVLISNFTDEKQVISKVLISAEEFLVVRYTQEFNLKAKELGILQEKFHQAYINKDLNKVLLLYNEIITNFKSLPDVFIEKKIEIYKKVNKLFELVNKLIMNRNVFLFLETYEYGKKIEALREYLGHVSLMVEIDYKSLSNVKKKIEDLPDKFYDEKQELLMKLKVILNENKNSVLKNQNGAEKDSVKFVVGNSVSEILSGSSKRDVVPKLDLKKVNLNNFKNDLSIFEKTHDKGEILNLYKKIMADIKKLAVTQDKKKKMILILNKELHKKRLS